MELDQGKGNPQITEKLPLYDEENEEILSLDAPVPRFLKFNYVIWILFGIVWFYLFWAGSDVSYFDRGYWFQLQKAANTTFPAINADELPPPAHK